MALAVAKTIDDVLWIKGAGQAGGARQLWRTYFGHGCMRTL